MLIAVLCQKEPLKKILQTPYFEDFHGEDISENTISTFS